MQIVIPNLLLIILHWNKKGKITGNHYKDYGELIEDLDDVWYSSDLKEKWHLESFEKRNFINIEERA
jgi:phage pi2 protein 07